MQAIIARRSVQAMVPALFAPQSDALHG